MWDVAVIGSGMSGLSAAALLANAGKSVVVLEQNWIPGGCTSSYWRKGFVFESGATTLVGMDPGMPLKYLLDRLGLAIPMRPLTTPMKVKLPTGEIITRYQPIDQWILETKKHFNGNQEGFWRLAFEISQFVWSASTRYRTFPPDNFNDILKLIQNFKIKDLKYVPYAFKTTQQVMKDFGVNDPVFEAFVDEQLLITAQNKRHEVNFLFGAAALCYTNYGNYYVDGGLINLVTPLVDFIEGKGGQLKLKSGVNAIYKKADYFSLTTKTGTFDARKVIATVPLNNLANMLEQPYSLQIEKKLIHSAQLNSAFQVGIGFKTDRKFDVLHHQLHLSAPLPGLDSHSIFVSLSHPEDNTRSDKSGHAVASVSTHWPNPESNFTETKQLEEIIINELEKAGFLQREDIVYLHSSGPKSWEKWTGRKWGFVGGYPQFKKILPWQMAGARLQPKGLYLAGDTAYPGQGIPGATLSGIIAAEKLLADVG